MITVNAAIQEAVVKSNIRRPDFYVLFMEYKNSVAT